MTVRDYIQAAIATIREPREMVHTLAGSTLPRQERWLLLILLVLLTTILSEISYLATAPADATTPPLLPFLNHPLLLAGIQVFFLMLLVVMIDVVGQRMAKGSHLDHTILAVAWLEFVMLCIQVLQVLVMVLIAPFGVLIGLASIVLFFWLLSVFIEEIYDYQSTWAVFFSVLGGLVVFAVVTSLILASFGVQLPG